MLYLTAARVDAVIDVWFLFLLTSEAFIVFFKINSHVLGFFFANQQLGISTIEVKKNCGIAKKLNTLTFS